MAVWSVVKASELQAANRLDAEYHRPDLRDLADRLASQSVALGDIAAWMTQGPNPRFVEDGRACLNGRNIAGGWVNQEHPNFVTQEEFESLRKWQPKPGDILITLKGLGSIGQTGLVSTQLEAIFSRDLGLVRLDESSGFLPEYVFAYLSSITGRRLVDRATTGGTGQMTLAVSYLRRLPVPKASHFVQQRIGELIRQSQSAGARSASLYLQAERMVLEEIGWGEVTLSQPGCWWTPLRRSLQVHRVDPEHFQPKYDNVLAALEKTRHAKALGDIASYMKRGLQPTYVVDGEVLVVNSRHLGRYLPRVEATERTDQRFWDLSSRTRLQERDVLLYSTGAYVGRTNIWLERQRAVASNHVTVIRPDRSCDPRYLAVFLNAPPGLLQTEKWASGSAQREIYPGDLRRFLIYLPPRETQEKVAQLVEASYEAGQKAKAVLDEAKQNVDLLVEGYGGESRPSQATTA